MVTGAYEANVPVQITPAVVDRARDRIKAFAETAPTIRDSYGLAYRIGGLSTAVTRVYDGARTCYEQPEVFAAPAPSAPLPDRALSADELWKVLVAEGESNLPENRNEAQLVVRPARGDTGAYLGLHDGVEDVCGIQLPSSQQLREILSGPTPPCLWEYNKVVAFDWRGSHNVANDAPLIIHAPFDSPRFTPDAPQCYHGVAQELSRLLLKVPLAKRCL